MLILKEICPCCGEVRVLGPWSGEGGFARLCGSCKIRITFDDPGRKANLAAVAAYDRHIRYLEGES